MVQPCKKASREKLLELYRNRVFFYVSDNTQQIQLCILDREHSWNPATPFVTMLNDDFTLSSFSQCVGWDMLYDGWEEADKRVKHIEKLYTKSFYKKPIVSILTLEKYKGELVKIEKEISERLKEYPNFLGVSFCDVHAGGIQILGYHKEIKNHTYGNVITIAYDFSNKDEVANEFVEMWKAQDNPESVNKLKFILDYGDKYGWD